MKRLMIIGCGGSGKSTLSKKIGFRLNIPVISLDKEYWKPGWIETQKEEWERKVTELIKLDTWVMDGNYGGTIDMRIERADTIIYMDKPTLVSLSRVIKRSIKHFNRTRPGMTENCPENLNLEFLYYVLKYNKTRRKLILDKLNALSDSKSIFILRSDNEVDNFLNSLPLRS